jgi:hypothetical protein
MYFMTPIKKVYKISFLKKVLRYFLRHRPFSALPDKLVLKLLFWCEVGKALSLDKPTSFNEKLQWLKLNDRNPQYTMLVDKYRVREYIAQTIGEKYLIPLIGCWQCVEDIDFNLLPNQFVLKCNHDSGGLVICKDKAIFDIEKAKKHLRKRLSYDYFYMTREWPYKKVKPCIVCEEYLQDDIINYKYFCFQGAPRFLSISQGLVIEHTVKVCYYDMDWNLAPFHRLDYPILDIDLPKPKLFEEMAGIAKRLSKGIPFVRVDLYEVGERVYFSEMTLTPGGGYTQMEPKSSEYMLGNLLRSI